MLFVLCARKYIAKMKRSQPPPPPKKKPHRFTVHTALIVDNFKFDTLLSVQSV